MKINLITVTSEIGVGKTSLLKELYNEIKDRKTNCIAYGLLQPSFLNGKSEHDGYNLLLLDSTKEKEPNPVPILTRNPNYDASKDISDSNRRWVFREEMFPLARDHLFLCWEKSIRENGGPIVFIVDELGVHESKGKGHWTAIETLFRQCSTSSAEKTCTWILAIRSGLVETFVQRLTHIYPEVNHILAVKMEPTQLLQRKFVIQDILHRICPCKHQQFYN
jgi:hypothetical protein